MQPRNPSRRQLLGGLLLGLFGWPLARTAAAAVLFAEMVAPERVEMGAGIHPFGLAILMASPLRTYTCVTRRP